MPSVAPEVIASAGVVVKDGTHPAFTLNQVRLFAWVKLGREHASRQAVLDTGAPCTVLSRRVWAAQDRRKAITWLTHPPGLDGNLPVLRIGGGRYGFRLGQIDIRVSSLAGDELAAVPVLVQCVEGESRGQQPLEHGVVLGLAGGLLHGRAFTLEADAAGARWAAALAGP